MTWREFWTPRSKGCKLLLVLGAYSLVVFMPLWMAFLAAVLIAWNAEAIARWVSR